MGRTFTGYSKAYTWQQKHGKIISTGDVSDLLLLSFKIIREEMSKGLTQEIELELKNLPLFTASKS